MGQLNGNANVIRDTEDNVLRCLLNTIGEWFSDHPQASEDCRNYVEQFDLFEGGLLDEVFGREDLGLPDEVIVSAEDVEIKNWGDEEEVNQALSDYLSDAFGYCLNEFNYELDTCDSGEVVEIIVKDINWDTTE